MQSPLLSIAYAPPIQYFIKLYETDGGIARIEAHENYVKQSYRNRCYILGPNGPQALTIPIEHHKGIKLSIREIRLSRHLDWRHQHIHAIHTAYGPSPYFEYYWEDIQKIISQPYELLWDLNWDLTLLLTRMLDLAIRFEPTIEFMPPLEYTYDWRYLIRPCKDQVDNLLETVHYYQPRCEQFGFVANLSILDLLFNMGPESLLTLRAYSKLQVKPCS